MLPGRQNRRLVGGGRPIRGGSNAGSSSKAAAASPSQPRRRRGGGAVATARSRSPSVVAADTADAADDEPVVYEQPAMDLSDAAKREVGALAQNGGEFGASRHALLAHHRRAAELLGEGADDAQRALQARAVDLRRAAQNREAKGVAGEDGKGPNELASERAVRKLGATVPQLTRDLEAAMRGVVDGRVALEDEKVVIGLVLGRIALLQQAAVRERAERREARRLERERARAAAAAAREEGEGEGEEEGAGAGEDGEDGDIADDDTDAGDAEQPVKGPRDLMSELRVQKAAEWEAQAANVRYSRANDYVGFRQVLHDARYSLQDAPPPLADPAHWFTEDGNPRLGLGRAGGVPLEWAGQRIKREGTAGDDEMVVDQAEFEAAEEEEEAAVAEEEEEEEEEVEEDDELVVEGIIMSIKCPLSMQDLTEPWTSKTCHHTFNRAAIMGWFRGKHGRVQCPQTGCATLVAKSDFAFDAAMDRRVKDMLERRRRQDELDDEDSDAEGDTTMMERGRMQTRRVRRMVGDAIEDNNE